VLKCSASSLGVGIWMFFYVLSEFLWVDFSFACTVFFFGFSVPVFCFWVASCSRFVEIC